MVVRTALFLTILMLSGCMDGDKARAQFENYQTRLANVLDTDAVALSESAFIPLPRKRDVVLPVPDVRMGLLDAYELRECGLFQLIAERNSILGKVQDAFHLLDYETKLLSTLSLCLASLENETLYTQLSNAKAQKEAAYQTVYWNTLVGSEAWRQQLSPSGSVLIPPNTAFPHSEALLAINAFADVPHRTENIVSLQEPIEKQRYLGTLFYSLDESTRWLSAITAQLYRDDHRVICGKNRDQTKLNYLRNVFDKYYVGEVQPYLSMLSALYRDVQPALEQIALQTPDVPVMDSYKTAYWQGEHYQAFNEAVKAHVGYWQQLFKRCNMQIAP